MVSIIHAGETRKCGLNFLGDGCRNCSVKNKCFMDKCNIVQYKQYQGLSDLANRYNYHINDLGFECYIRKYKYGFILIAKGEKYKSGEIDSSWHIHFYDENMKTLNVEISNNGHEIEKRCGRYLYIKHLKETYGINDMIPLKNSNSIMLH